LSKTRPTSRGFTLIELLVVIGVIATLAALLLGAVAALGIGSKKRKTESILAILRQGIEVSTANTGSLVSAVEHPLAGSRPTRSAFVGVRGRLPPNGGGGAPLATLDATSEALVGINEWHIDPGYASDRSRVLMPDDLFADDTVPLLFGVRRDRLTILGADMQTITRYRRIQPKHGEVGTGTNFVPGPYANTNPRFSDPIALVAPAGVPIDSKRALDYAFGSTTIMTELSSLKALFVTPDGLPVAPASMIRSNRLWSAEGTIDGRPSWTPGRLVEGSMSAPPMGPNWKLYRIPGAAIYDAWGREILFSQSSTGGIRLMSGGNDGAICWDPGANKTIDTPIGATTPGGDDRDGSHDNIKMESGP
jgi:prepilin-type N-terminal cleavage/methylation domain-containing protein